MMELLRNSKVKNTRLFRWELGFFCIEPQPDEYQFGDDPKTPWIGTVMFQQLVGCGLILNNGELISGPSIKISDRSTPESYLSDL